ncbi:MAG TPA: hypothetical protein DHV42_03550 [Lachnospiraceae bacterium]|nr:hypothetical protein [Lachnospiraceae bacterium]
MRDTETMSALICELISEKGHVTVQELNSGMEHPGIDDSVIWTEVIDDIEAVNPDVEDEPDELQDEDAGDDSGMDSIRLYMSDVGRYRLLSREEEYELAVRVRHGDREAREKMITSNLRLVISIAKRYMNSSNIDFQDLMQSGNLGLMKAVDRFDPERGNRFATYATWWIKQSVIRYISDNCGTIRIPVYMNDIQKRIGQFISQYQNEYGKEPSDEALAKKFGFTECTISAYRNVKRGIKSIDTYASENYDSDISSYLADPAVDVEDEAIRQTLNDEVSQALDSVLRSVLRERDADIIRMRWGCDGTQRGKTLEEIGKKYHLTKERIRQIEDKAMDQLRESPTVCERLRPWIA